MLDYILKRLKEASTYQGIIALLALFGVHLSPEQSAAIVQAAIAAIGAIALFLPNKASDA